MKRSSISMIFFAIFLFCCCLAANGQTSGPQDDGDIIYKRAEVDQAAKILSKPRAKTDGRCKNGTSGTARFEVILRRSGKVDIQKTVQSSGCGRFDNNAIEAAKSIKFEPAVKGGQPVSMLIILEFSYATY